ncbi:hypothetical protein U1Q18_034132 [Sarracenia purpurea var. burkii]
MSSIVCQGLQSCLEPRLVEARVLRHKLLPPKSNSFSQRSSSSPPDQENHQEINSDNEEAEEKPNDSCITNTKNGDLGGWSFIQSLTSMSKNRKEEVSGNQEVYVHPLVKRSSSTLSKKSLEMCTENLGSETGSDISESTDELTEPSLSPLSPTGERSHLTRRSESPTWSKNPTRRGGSLIFPPPLKASPGRRPAGDKSRPRSFLQQLCMLKDSSLDYCCHGEEEGVDDEKLYSVEEDEDFGETESAPENYNDDDDDYEHDDDDDDEDGWVGIGGNSGNGGCDIEIGEFPCRPSRCKEGGQGNKVMSWGPFWVATS